MSIFGTIMDKIFHHPSATSADASSATPTALSAASPEAAPATSQASAAPAQAVDVGAVLAQMASTKGGGGNYQTSIVDLLKLLDLDFSLDARKQLGQELDVHASADGSAEQNIALHKAVVQKLAENGGVVPDSMKG